MNARNLEYILPYNKKKQVGIADSKLETKRILEENDIPVPRYIGTIKDVSEILEFDWESLPQRFVIKPNSGFAGEGIIVLNKKVTEEDGSIFWETAGGERWSVKQLQAHTLNILDGSYSLSNAPDIAFFEEKIINSPEMRNYAYKGIPDIRVIVFNGVPTMAMLRLPTKSSGGRANIAKGAIGCGIDLSLGVTTSAMVKKPRRKLIDEHPDTGADLQNIEIPYWEEILQIAVKCQEVTGLGFLGVDVSLDKYRGPVILEINARPGLDIQLANVASLGDRLRRVSGLRVPNNKRGIILGKNLFGGDIERRVEDVSGLTVLGSVESIKIVDNQGSRVQVLARIDTGESLGLIDASLAEKLELPVKTRKTTKSKRKVVEAVLYIEGRRMETILAVTEMKSKKYKIAIGRRDLRGYLIDPLKKAKG